MGYAHTDRDNSAGLVCPQFAGMGMRVNIVIALNISLNINLVYL